MKTKQTLTLFVVLLFIYGCGSNNKLSSSNSNQFKLKSLRTEGFTIKYPNTWMRFGAHGYAYLTPIKLRKENLNIELHHISINKNIILIDDFNKIENILDKHGNSLKFHEKSKNFKLIKISGDDRFIYRIEYLIEFKLDKGIHKGVEYFFMSKGKLKYIQFQMREELFHKYINEAMIIINSLQLNK